MIAIEDLGVLPYRDAWKIQEARHAAVANGSPETILLVEHPPVITQGRRPLDSQHLLASADYLKQLNVDFVESDRGGDITFHGPGQVVAYPIIRLADHRLSVGAYVKALEQAAISALAVWGVVGRREQGAVGVWVEAGERVAKICALGVRIRRGVSLHGLALNVSTDLRYFDLIVPCGLQGRPVTSLQTILGDKAPGIPEVKAALASAISHALVSSPPPGTL